MEIFRTSDLVIAELRHMDLEYNGVEMPEKPTYAFLKKFGNIYINALDEDDFLPVYQRTLYTNTTSNGESYGNQLSLIHGDVADGECYVILVPLSEFTEKEKFSYDELETVLRKIQGVRDLNKETVAKKLKKSFFRNIFNK